MNIAICDDNLADLSNLKTMINELIALHRGKHQIRYTTFHNAVDLIAAIESRQQFDLILMDILMPSMTGMEAAKEIRQLNHDVKIIFLTDSSEFAVESYSVDAYYYALKPIGKEKLIILIDKVISEMELHAGSSLLIKSKNGLIRVYINRLEFVEVIGRIIRYHLTDGSTIEAVGSMSELEKELLSNHCFVKPHRSYIINMSYIVTLSQSKIKMQSLALVPMAKANYRSVKSSFIAFAFKEIDSM